MRARWTAVVLTTAVLVVINLVARLVVRLSGVSDERELLIAAVSLGAMGLALAVPAFLWSRRHLLPRVAADVSVTAAVSGLLVLLVGPFVSGTTPFAAGAGFFLVQLGVCAGVLALGALLGIFVTTAFGLDPKSRAWQRRAESVRLPKDARLPGKAKTRPAKGRAAAKPRSTSARR